MTNRHRAFIAWILILEAACGIATLAWTIRQAPLPALIWGVFTPLIAGTLAAGIGLLMHRSWAPALSLLAIAVQVPVLSAPTFQYSLWMGTHLDVVAAISDGTDIGVNVVALCLLVWCLYRYNTNARPGDATPASTAPFVPPDA